MKDISWMYGIAFLAENYDEMLIILTDSEKRFNFQFKCETAHLIFIFCIENKINAIHFNNFHDP